MRSIWMVCAGLAILVLGWLQWKWSKAFETSAMEVQRRQIHEGLLRLGQDVDEELADIFLFFLTESRKSEEKDSQNIQQWLNKWFEEGGSPLVQGIFWPEDHRQGQFVEVSQVSPIIWAEGESPFEIMKQNQEVRSRRSHINLVFSEKLWMAIPTRAFSRSGFLVALEQEQLINFCRERIQSQVPLGADLHWNLSRNDFSGKTELVAKEGPILQQFDDQFQFGGLHPRPQSGRFKRRVERGGLRNSPQDPLYTLKVAHKAGSLRRSFAQIRHRQLMVSSGLLILLGWVLWMLFRSYRSLQYVLQHEKSFVAQVTHEVLTPVAAMRSLGENLSDGLVKNQEKAKEYGNLLLQNTNRLNHLLEQIFFYSKLSSQTIKVQCIKVQQLFDEIKDLVHSIYPQATVESQFDPNAVMLCEPEGMVRAIFNLCDNALKHSGEDWVQIKFYSQINPQKGMLIEIRDRGEGFREDQISLLTKPFARGTQAKNEQIPGSGLGLALVETVAKAHDGFLKIQPGKPGCVLLFIAEVES